MAATPRPLSADSSIGAWLEHPVGGPIIRDMLTQAGQDPDVRRPVRCPAIKRLVKLGRGSFTTEMLDELVGRVEAGDIPTPALTESDVGAPAEPVEISATDERAEWTEQITPGRFTGRR